MVGKAIKSENKPGSEELVQTLEKGASFVLEENVEDMVKYVNSKWTFEMWSEPKMLDKKV